MVIGQNVTPVPLDVKRIVLLSVATDEIADVAKFVAQELHMSVHFLNDASEEAINSACELDHAILIPSPTVARQEGVLAALAKEGKIFFNMVNPVRIAVALGLSGDEGEAFCREAIAFEDMSLGMSHMILPDGSTPEDLTVNVLQNLGHFKR